MLINLNKTMLPVDVCMLHLPWSLHSILLSAESLFVCIEVLQPSQPNGVMSSVVNLPNHTFTGQT